MESGIYKILNKKNNKFYVGSTKNFRKRWVKHKYLLNLNKHENYYLQNSWNKYGEKFFEFIIIENVKIDNLIEREQYYIDILNACNKNIGYNLSPTANSTLGYKHSEDSKKKMSVLKKGKPSTRKNYVHSEETKKKIGLSNKTSQLGRKHSESTKSRISEWHSGKILSKETKKKISKKLINNQNALGNKHTKETKNIISNKNKGKNNGENNGMSITNKKEVLSIRNDYDNNHLTIKELMIKYDKNYQFIYKIVKRLRWKWL